MKDDRSAATGRPDSETEATEQRAHRRITAKLAIAVAASLSTVFAPGAHAASISWFNAAGGDLTVPTNWFGGVAPGPADAAIFSVDATISFFVPLGNGPVTYQSADFLRGINTLALNDNTLTLSDGLVVADAGLTGSLTLTSGNIAANGFESVNIGNDAASVGAMTIDSASLVFEERADVGKFGSGTLSVIDGGTVSSQGGIGAGRLTVGREAGSTGLVQVIGGGSSIVVDDNSGAVIVGSSGTGTMNITGGGDVLANNASIGSQATGVGDVLVSGNGSTFDVIADSNSTFSIGGSGTGTLTINNGADASSDGTDIGNLAGSTGTLIVAGVGSTYTDTADLIVGEAGNGTLRVENGGEVFADQFIVGEESGSVGSVLIQTGGRVTATGTIATLIAPLAGSDGTVTVDGIGSQLDSSAVTLGVGTSGTGRLNVTNGASVLADNLVVGASTTGDSSVLVDGTGSNIAITDELRMGTAGLPTPAALTISNGGSITAVNMELINSGSNVTVTDSGSQLTIVGNIAGLSGTPAAEGNLLISNGGQVTNQQSRWEADSTLIVEDAGSTWTNNGSLRLEGVALTVRDGGTVTSTFGAFDFDASGQSSLVTGAGSTLDLSNGLFLGSGGSASLNIENGGSLITNFTTFGDSQTDAGTLTIDGVGSSWTDTANVTLGFDGTGTVNIQNSASALVGNVSIAAFTGSNGTLSLDTGGQLTASDVAVGGAGFSAGGTGLLDIRGGATAQVGSLVVFTDGELNVDGGTLQATNLDVSNGTFNFEDGLIIVDGGTLTTVPNLTFLSASGSRELRLDNAATSSLNSLSISDSAFTLDIRAGSSLSITNQMPLFGGSVLVSDVGSTLNVGSLLGVGTSTTGSLTINAGADVTADGIVVGSSFVAGDGIVSVDGVGSSLTSSGSIVLDGASFGTVTVTGGATVSNTGSSEVVLADPSGSTGSLAIDGSGSTWTMSGALRVGGNGDGTSTVSNGASLSTAGMVTLARDVGSSGNVTIDGAGSSWTIAGSLEAGLQGTGDVRISNGGFIDAVDVKLATGSGSGSLEVDGAGSTLTARLIRVGDEGTGVLAVTNGATMSTTSGVTVADNSATSSGSISVDGIGSTLTTNGVFLIGRLGAGTMSITNGAVVSGDSLAQVGNFGVSTGTVNVNGPGSTWSIDQQISLGLGGSGAVNVTNGGTVFSDRAFVGFDSAGIGSGEVTVGGGGASWSVSDQFAVGGTTSGEGGAGLLTVNSGGNISAPNQLKIWTQGTVDLNGGTINAGSIESIGTLNFNAGALNVTNSDFTVATGGVLGSSISLTSLKSLGVVGTTTLSGASTLSIDGGTFSTGSLVDNGGFAFNSGTFNLTNENLTIGTGGLFGGIAQFGFGQAVNVTNNTTVDNGAVLLLANGSFSSGTTTNNGTISLDGVVSTLGGGALTNNALVTGDGRVTAQLNNAAAGEVRAANGDTLTFAGAGNTNTGRINLLGGTVDFDGDLTNASGGVIAGRGTLIADGGLTNAGNIGLSSGNTDIFGDVDNVAGGSIIISGAGTATFFDDLIHNGTEIRVSAGSNAVFFGAVSGAGSYTGTGALFFEGDLNPGNSPGLVDVQGDMNLGTTARTIIELAGLDRGTEYDAFDIGGELQLGGELDVVLYDDGDGLFSAQDGDSFDLFIAESIFGDFDLMTLAVLSEGLGWRMNVLTDEFGSMDVLRLDVVAAAVPVPAAAWLFGSALASLMWIRRRQVRAA